MFSRTGPSPPRAFGAGGTALALLLVLGADAAAVRGCPHHLASSGEAASHLATAPTAAHDHDGAPAPASDGHEEDAPCSCIGLCHASAAAPAPASPPSAQQAPIEVERWDVRSSEGSASVRPPYFLPFANAPPLPA